MKKKIVTAMLTVIMAMSTLTGCGAEATTEPIETVAETEAVEETVVEESAETVEETVIEEATEVVEEVSFERENYVLCPRAINLVGYEKTPDLTVDNETYNSNEFIDLDVMSELHSRGYDIDNFVVSWMVALNESGNLTLSDGTIVEYNGDDSEEDFIKLFPIFIKTEGIDTSKLVYNFNNDRENLSLNYTLGEDIDLACEVFYAIHNEVCKMKADDNYVEIDFNIPETEFLHEVESTIQANMSAEEEQTLYKEMTLNDWYNGMIYGMFVSETIDLDGLFEIQSNR